MFTRLFAREAGLDLVLAGHYRTELPGIVALTELAAERHGLDWLVVEDEPVG
jgi:putative NIF3 family GTP cyclohydrolase 1 type 2